MTLAKIAVPVMTAAVLCATAAISSASPVPDVAPQNSVNFTATATDTQSKISVDSGSIVVEGNVLKIKAPNGTDLTGAPLTFRVDDFEFPIAAEVNGRAATLTPRLSMDAATYKPIALPFEDKAPWKNEYDREQAAWNRMTATIGLGASLGTLIGGLGGGALGCVLGGIAGATIASATIVGLFGPFIPAAALGCIGGILAVGALGTLLGQMLVTAPVAIGAVIQYFTTIQQPFVSPAK
ncbi:hypothetical protein [Nocardia sp. NPDC055049]